MSANQPGRPGNDRIKVTSNPERSCFQAWVNGEYAGICEYQRAGDVVAFTHTEVEPEFEGRGVASALVREALDDVRAKGKCKVVPVCPYVKVWIQRHPDYHDLVHG